MTQTATPPAAPARKTRRPRSARFNNLIIALPLVIGALVSAYIFWDSQRFDDRIRDTFRVKEGQALPALPVKDRAGAFSTLTEVAAGKRTVVVLMDSECPHCHTELASIQQLRKEGVRTPLAVVSVGDTAVFGGLAERYADLPMYSDVNGEIRGKYRLLAVPATLVVDAAGKVSELHVGLRNPAQLRALLDPS